NLGFTTPGRGRTSRLTTKFIGSASVPSHDYRPDPPRLSHDGSGLATTPAARGVLTNRPTPHLPPWFGYHVIPAIPACSVRPKSDIRPMSAFTRARPSAGKQLLPPATPPARG